MIEAYDKMDQTQTKIDTEIDALSILHLLLTFHNECIWTKGIFADFLSWESARAETAVTWLIEREFIAKNFGSYIRTELGREYYEGAKSKALFQINSNVWKIEALTGVRQSEAGPRHNNWQRSNIENGVIPRTSSPFTNYSNTTPEEVYLKTEEAKQLKAKEKKAAQMLGLSIREFRRLFKAGLIKLCYGGGEKHLGRFHRKGKGTQPICAECRKRKKNE